MKRKNLVMDGRKDGRRDKLHGDHRFGFPNGHSHDEKALIFFKLVEKVKTVCLFSKKTNRHYEF